MIEHMIPLVASWMPLWDGYLVYIFALAFLGWVPTFFIALLRR